MRKIVISISNGLLSEGIVKILGDAGGFVPIRALGNENDSIVKDCQALAADILLAEVSYVNGSTIDSRLREAQELRRLRPHCRIAFLCDENSTPEIARDVILAKRDGLIDAFFYSSVSAKYLAAALMAI